ncbi:MAG: hypothetical protein AAF211_32340 [Myxococcota bacterium]
MGVAGVGTLLLVQVVRGAPSIAGGLSGVAGLVAVLDLTVLMVGTGLMALSLGRQARAVASVLDGSGSVDRVLVRMRRFWWIFALTLGGVLLLGCGTLFTGAAGAVEDVVDQLGGGE